MQKVFRLPMILHLIYNFPSQSSSGFTLDECSLDAQHLHT